MEPPLLFLEGINLLPVAIKNLGNVPTLQPGISVNLGTVPTPSIPGEPNALKACNQDWPNFGYIVASLHLISCSKAAKILRAISI